MRLTKKGWTLFPRKLTVRWCSFDEDYEKIHEAEHTEQLSKYSQDCPWSTSPKTIDEFLEICDARAKWEEENKTTIPAWWNCILTHSLFEEMAREVKTLTQSLFKEIDQEVKEVRDAKRNT